MQDGDATGELGELQEYVEALLTDFKSAPERSIPEHLANEPFDSTASRAAGASQGQRVSRRGVSSAWESPSTERVPRACSV